MISNLPTARVSTLQTTLLAQRSLQSTQAKLLRAQTEVQTGRKLMSASDNPGDAQAALLVRRSLERISSYQANLRIAETQLAHADSALGDITTLLNDASTQASANVGTGVTADQRRSAAAVVDSIYSQILALSNRQVEGLYLFGGDRGTQAPFVEQNGGVRFVGSTTAVKNSFDDISLSTFGITADQVFGATSARVGSVDLAPATTGSTLLADLRGATGQGIRVGTLVISNGTTSANVDLADANDLQDVVDRINAAGLTGLTATVSASGIDVAAAPGVNLTINDVGGGTSASDLGILRPTSAGAGLGVVGSALSPVVNGLTPLSSLFGGTGVPLAGGLRISAGTSNVDVDFTGAVTVEDFLNRINLSGSGALARIKADKTGIEIVNPVQGLELRVADNGGSVASTLGVRSFTPASTLAELNSGRGVDRSVASADLRITAKNGTAYDIELSAATTVQDVMDAINAATGGAVTASFGTTGNGLVLTDTTGGGGALTVGSVNFTTTAADLGIAGTTTGTTLVGQDVQPIATSGIFSGLLALRRALETNNIGGITAAGEQLSASLETVIRQRGVLGAKAQEVEGRQDRLEGESLILQSNLSDLEEVDLTQAITRFTLLQTTLEANLKTIGQTLNVSLLDFLR